MKKEWQNSAQAEGGKIRAVYLPAHPYEKGLPIWDLFSIIETGEVLRNHCLGNLQPGSFPGQPVFPEIMQSQSDKDVITI